jgi:hypothetical protein
VAAAVVSFSVATVAGLTPVQTTWLGTYGPVSFCPYSYDSPSQYRTTVILSFGRGTGFDRWQLWIQLIH